MKHTEILTRLSVRCTAEVVYVITMDTILLAIVRRMGEEALILITKDLNLAREEVQAVFDHYLDEREYIGMGLDAFEICCKISNLYDREGGTQ